MSKIYKKKKKKKKKKKDWGQEARGGEEAGRRRQFQTNRKVSAKDRVIKKLRAAQCG